MEQLEAIEPIQMNAQKQHKINQTKPSQAKPTLLYSMTHLGETFVVEIAPASIGIPFVAPSRLGTIIAKARLAHVVVTTNIADGELGIALLRHFVAKL